MSKVCTNWAQATVDPQMAAISLLSCLNAGKNAWIEVRKNTEKDCAIPIMRSNPELDNPFNWTMNYGVPRNEKALESRQYLNETERDMTYNWTCCYGTEKAIEEYQKNRTITRELFEGTGIAHPVRIEDANYYRKNILGDNYDHEYWTTYWKPKNGIPYYVADDRIEDVFVVCYDNSPVDKRKAIEAAGQFLLDYAGRMEE